MYHHPYYNHHQKPYQGAPSQAPAPPPPPPPPQHPMEMRKVLIAFKSNVSSGPIMAFVQESMQRGIQINKRPDFHEPVYSVVMTVPWQEIDGIRGLSIVDSVSLVG